MNEKTLNTYRKYAYIGLFAIVAILYIHTFGKVFLNDGDHGRDLFSFLITSQGKMPFVDYRWIYGPLMPFYYAFLFKVFTPCISIALSGWYVLFTLCIVCYFFLLKDVVNPFVALIITVIFITFHGFYFHTFNHAGGTLFVILTMLFFLKFIQQEQDKYLTYTAISLAILGLIKLNIMLSILLSCVIIMIILKKSSLIKFLLITFLPLLVIYGIFLLLVPDHSIYSIFPYKSNLLTAYNDNIFTNIIRPMILAPSVSTIENPLILIQYNIIFSKLTYILAFLFCFIALYVSRNDKTDFNIILFLTITSVLISNEFFLLGIDYSLRYWTLPVLLLSCTYSVYYLVKTSDKLKKGILVFVTCIALSGLFITYLIYNVEFANLNLSRAKIKVFPASYARVVYTTSKFIEENTSKDDRLLTLPYNCLYLFLTDRKPPTKHIEFMYLSGLNDADEKQIIEALKHRSVPYIITSNMMSETKLGTGEFGKTHLKKLAKYIDKNYYPFKVFPEYFDEKKHLAYGKVITILKRK